MVLTKITLFAVLLVLGVLNHWALHGRVTLAGSSWPRSVSGPRADAAASAIVWKRRVEVEAGLALVTVFLAASIGSAPPPLDVGVQPATRRRCAAMFTPRWPRFETPSLAELAAGARASATPTRRARPRIWRGPSSATTLPVFSSSPWACSPCSSEPDYAPWARHWPLLIFGLAGFVAWNIDPEGWQTGVVGFWQQLLSPEVVQHRIMLAITALFGVAEWRVRSGRHPMSRWRYVFPGVCLMAGVFLLTHVHEVGNGKSAFLMELTHLALGLVSLVAGWSRWLELRLPHDRGQSTRDGCGDRPWPCSGCCWSFTARVDRLTFSRGGRFGPGSRTSARGEKESLSFAKISSHLVDDGPCPGDRPGHARGTLGSWSEVAHTGPPPGPTKQGEEPKIGGRAA